MRHSLRILFLCLLWGPLGSYAAPLCSEVFFQREKLHGVDLGVMARIKSLWAHEFERDPGLVARERYAHSFEILFADEPIALLKNNRTHFENSNGMALGWVSAPTDIHLVKNTKNHPFYALLHAHETQHSLDFHSQKIPVTKSAQMAFVGDSRSRLILESEIRAFYKTIEAARYLFSEKEIQYVLNREQNPALKELAEDLLRYQGAHEFILENLLKHYQKLIRNAQFEDNASGETPREYIRRKIIESGVPDSPRPI